MLRAAGRSSSGKPLIILGLEEGNVTRLRAGQPIHFYAGELGFDGEIVIMLGKDAESIARQLEPARSPDAVIIDKRNQPKQ